MNEAGEIKHRIGCLMAGIAYPIMAILGAIIHVWTIVIAYLASGLMASVLSFIFPVLAQLFWGYAMWNATGTFLNAYCLALIGYAGLWAIVVIGVGMTES